MGNTVKLTVWLSTYNQEPYVAQALDSILMQKTNFPFEIIAADDCSTDRTQEIILEYQKQYPDLIIPYFTSENIGGCRKLTECIDAGLFRGDYLSYLEGDDYWLGEDRLQTLVDYLEAHPEYSRISHRRKVIDETGADKGFDIPEDVLNKTFTISDFLAGKNYSDFGSVFRNYFKECGSKYHELFWASRNVIDFQDMFITQDFGPVYVTENVFGVYRSRSVAGATNYNSMISNEARWRDHIRIAEAVQEFYGRKYDLSPLLRFHKSRLLSAAAEQQSSESMERLHEITTEEEMRQMLPERVYLSIRAHRWEEIRFLHKETTPQDRRGLLLLLCGYAGRRICRKLLGEQRAQGLVRRGYIRN